MSNIAPSPAASSVLFSFSYRAQQEQGEPISGTINATGLDQATQLLQAMGLSILAIEPTSPAPPKRPLGIGDFLAFNEQLAQLTGAGLPVEHGLKLIARDLHRGRLASAVAAISDELEKGVPLADALSHHRGQFPPLYGRLVEAGIRSNNLSALLLNLGMHLETVRRLRAALWRAAAYPIMVLLALMIILYFLSQTVFPQYRTMYDMFKENSVTHFNMRTWRQQVDEPRPTLPWVTIVVFAVGDTMPIILITAILLLASAPLVLRSRRHSNRTIEQLALRIPLIGPILRSSLLSRWCDAAYLAVLAGMDLPGALRLASETVDSPGLMLDGIDLVHDLESGKPFDGQARRVLLPATIPTAIELASRSQNLPATLQSLSDLYRRQADARLENLPTVLTPLLLMLIAAVVGLVIAGLMLPMVNFIRWSMGGVF